MLSGNGRHRRPRQAPALIVAAGVTGSAIAIPLLGATSASAADGTTWDRVAECESAGQWSADSGNGYYGGLQISQADWEKYGGLTYASSADEASRSQQIAIAEKLLDDQGLTPWPTCGPLSGLSKNSGDILVDTGVANDSSSTSDSSGSSGSFDSSSSSTTSTPSGSSGSKSDSSSSGSSSPGSSSKSTEGAAENTTKADTGGDAQGADGSDTETTKSDNSGNSGQGGDSSGASENATTGAGRHRGGTADENTTGSAVDGRSDDSSGRHASRGAGASRDVIDGSYVVRAGDNLWTIADALDLEGGWAELYDANKKTVGVDPNLILPGQSLAVGAESGEK